MVNLMTVACSITVTIFYCYPIKQTVTADNMSELLQSSWCQMLIASQWPGYASPVLRLMALGAAMNWALHARKHYSGPQLEGAVDREQY